MCQLLLRSIRFLVSEEDLLVEAATWVARLMLSTFVVEAATGVPSSFVVESCQPFVAEAACRIPEETNPLQTKFCVICHRSFSELQ